MTDEHRSLIGHSIDPVETEYYERVSDSWWDPNGKLWPLHRLNQLRITYLRDQISKTFPSSIDRALPLKGLTILDVGCGGGLLCEPLALLGAKVTGIDVVARNVAVAKRHAQIQPDLVIDYRVQTAEALCRTKARFDIVLSMEVVEHVSDLQGFSDSCAELVRPGGFIGFATINRTLKSYVFAILGAEYILGWLPRGTHRWRKFVHPNSLESILSRKGFTVSDRRGIAINPLNRHFRLTSSLAVNFMLTARRES
ncbi:MAG: bifunctional 2-polyprenyl-6-hydroxyphenol methylase/3-demethylubiquinol 3-O-methyltransferase UbiG [Pseudomonadota bacterium]